MIARKSSSATSALSFITDKKQLKNIKPNTFLLKAYSDAEVKRDHLVRTRGSHHVVFVNGKRTRQPIPTVHSLALS